MERSAAASAELDSKLEADTVNGICQHSARLAALLNISSDTPHMVSPHGLGLTTSIRCFVRKSCKGTDQAC